MGSAHYDAHSLWQRLDNPFFQALNTDTKADTCVIGAGIAGLSIAYNLLKAGQNVVILMLIYMVRKENFPW